jgi:maltose O-acetyltransferase
MNGKRIAGYILYTALAKHLPESSSRGGALWTKMRGFCGRMMLAKCGVGVNIERNAVFSYKCEMGDYSGIGVNAQIAGRVVLGDNVMMGPDCTIYTRNHRFDRLDIPMRLQGMAEPRTVTIQSDAWIGGRVIILPGCTIGEGAIVGAGSVVTRDVAPYMIVAGNPAKVIGDRRERAARRAEEAK